MIDREAAKAFLLELINSDEVQAAIRRAVSVARPERDPEELLTVDAAARELGMSPAAVRKRVDRGALPARRIGRAVRVRRADVHALVRR